MKFQIKTFHFVFFTLIALMGCQSLAKAPDFSNSGGLIKGINLRNCSAGEPKKCVNLIADEAITSQFAPIFQFNKSELKIQNGSESEVIAVDSGYFDFSQDLILLQSNNNQEILVDLRNLTVRRFEK